MNHVPDLNHVELNYYSFMVSLDKGRRSCNVVDELSAKICVSSKKKDINIKVFNMVTMVNEATSFVKNNSCDYKCKFNNITCISNQKWNNETCQCDC